MCERGGELRTVKGGNHGKGGKGGDRKRKADTEDWKRRGGVGKMFTTGTHEKHNNERKRLHMV